MTSKGNEKTIPHISLPLSLKKDKKNETNAYLVGVIDTRAHGSGDTVVDVVLVVNLSGLGSDLVLLVQSLGLSLGGLDVGLDLANKSVPGIDLKALLNDLVLEGVSGSEDLGQDGNLGLVLLSVVVVAVDSLLEVGLNRDLAIDNHGVGQHAGSLGSGFYQTIRSTDSEKVGK